MDEGQCIGRNAAETCELNRAWIRLSYLLPLFEGWMAENGSFRDGCNRPADSRDPAGKRPAVESGDCGARESVAESVPAADPAARGEGGDPRARGGARRAQTPAGTAPLPQFPAGKTGQAAGGGAWR